MFAWLVLLSQAVVPEERDAVGTDAFDRDVLTLPASDLKSESACP